jgi:8-oxo-dGTP pyrophosphatase MutT (NUDIX family)
MYGHHTKLCTEPIISCGIICFKIDKIQLPQIEKFLFNKYINIEDYNYKNINYYNKINFHCKDIKFVMIQRKNSLSYIEFLRGRYNEKDNFKITSMFELMSSNEVSLIKNNNFETLWDNLWKTKANLNIYLKEMNLSKKKFNYLNTNNLFKNLEAKYNSPEWGFPKGRRNKYENNNACANREFTEETNLLNYTQYDRINSIDEVFMGTDNVMYKHIYYIAGSNNHKLSFSEDNYEIGDIGWFTIDQILKLLRPYNKTKIDIINQIYFFLSVLCDKIDEKNNSKPNVKNDSKLSADSLFV